MMDLLAHKFVATGATLGILDSMATDKTGVVPLGDRLGWTTLLVTIRSDLAAVGLDFPMDQIDRLLSDIKSRPNLNYESLKSSIVELRFRIQDQLKRSSCFILDRDKSQIYRAPREGWEEIVARFPQTTGDVEEARICFALARYAAAVFHTLQVAENGLIELGRFIGDNDPKSGWTSVTGRLSKIVKSDYKNLTSFEQSNFPFLQQVHGTAEAMKDAWRNKISHAQGRLLLMTADFSPRIAEEILLATRAFMRRLAEGLPSAES